MVKDKSTLTDEIVKKQYEELLHRGLPFLQIFPEMIQESNVAETFKIREKERNNNKVNTYDFYTIFVVQKSYYAIKRTL
jgi:hypothetical protein